MKTLNQRWAISLIWTRVLLGWGWKVDQKLWSNRGVIGKMFYKANHPQEMDSSEDQLNIRDPCEAKTIYFVPRGRMNECLTEMAYKHDKVATKDETQWGSCSGPGNRNAYKENWLRQATGASIQHVGRHVMTMAQEETGSLQFLLLWTKGAALRMNIEI